MEMVFGVLETKDMDLIRVWKTTENGSYKAYISYLHRFVVV